MEELFGLPPFPELFTEADKERMETLERLQKEQLAHYQQHFTEPAWAEKTGWERFWRTLTPPAPKWYREIAPYDVLGATPSQADRYMRETEAELGELRRFRDVATYLPPMLDTALFLYTLGEPVWAEAYLYDMFPSLDPSASADMRLNLTDDERGWLREWLEELKKIPPERVTEFLQKPYAPDKLEDISKRLAEALRLPGAEYLTPAQVMSTVAFSKDIGEIRDALRIAFPPQVEDEQAAFIQTQEERIRQELEDLGIIPTGDWQQDAKVIEERKTELQKKLGFPAWYEDDEGRKVEIRIDDNNIVRNPEGEILGKYNPDEDIIHPAIPIPDAPGYFLSYFDIAREETISILTQRLREKPLVDVEPFRLEALKELYPEYTTEEILSYINRNPEEFIRDIRLHARSYTEKGEEPRIGRFGLHYILEGLGLERGLLDEHQWEIFWRTSEPDWSEEVFGIPLVLNARELGLPTEQIRGLLARPIRVEEIVTFYLKPDVSIVDGHFFFNSDETHIFHGDKRIGKVDRETGKVVLDDPDYIWKAFVPYGIDKHQLIARGYYPPEAFNTAVGRAFGKATDWWFMPKVAGDRVLPSPFQMLGYAAMIAYLFYMGWQGVQAFKLWTQYSSTVGKAYAHIPGATYKDYPRPHSSVAPTVPDVKMYKQYQTTEAYQKWYSMTQQAGISHKSQTFIDIDRQLFQAWQAAVFDGQLDVSKYILDSVNAGFYAGASTISKMPGVSATTIPPDYHSSEGGLPGVTPYTPPPPKGTLPTSPYGKSTVVLDYAVGTSISSQKAVDQAVSIIQSMNLAPEYVTPTFIAQFVPPGVTLEVTMPLIVGLVEMGYTVPQITDMTPEQMYADFIKGTILGVPDWHGVNWSEVLKGISPQLPPHPRGRILAQTPHGAWVVVSEDPLSIQFIPADSMQDEWNSMTFEQRKGMLRERGLSEDYDRDDWGRLPVAVQQALIGMNEEVLKRVRELGFAPPELSLEKMGEEILRKMGVVVEGSLRGVETEHEELMTAYREQAKAVEELKAFNAPKEEIAQARELRNYTWGKAKDLEDQKAELATTMEEIKGFLEEALRRPPVEPVVEPAVTPPVTSVTPAVAKEVIIPSRREVIKQTAYELAAKPNQITSLRDVVEAWHGGSNPEYVHYPLQAIGKVVDSFPKGTKWTVQEFKTLVDKEWASIAHTSPGKAAFGYHGTASDAFYASVLGYMQRGKVVEVAAPEVRPEAPTTEAILGLLTTTPIHGDKLVRQSGLSASEVNTALSMLELEGKVRDVGGRNFVKVEPTPRPVEEAQAAYQEEVTGATAQGTPEGVVSKPEKVVRDRVREIAQKIEEDFTRAIAGDEELPETLRQAMMKPLSQLTLEERELIGLEAAIRELKKVEIRLLPAELQPQAQAILEAYGKDFEEGMLDRSLEISRAIADASARTGVEDDEFVIPAEFVDVARETSFATMLPSELIQVIQNLTAVRKPSVSQMVYVDPGADTKDVLARLVGALGGMPPRPPVLSDAMMAEGKRDRAMNKLKSYFWRTIRMERILQSLDRFYEERGLPSGHFYRTFFESLKHGINNEGRTILEETESLRAFIKENKIDIGKLLGHEKIQVLPKVWLYKEEMLGVYVHNKNPQNAFHLEHGNKITPEMQQQIIAQLSPEEVRLGDYMIERLTRIYDLADAARKTYEGKSLGHVEKYFPISLGWKFAPETSLERHITLETLMRSLSQRAMADLVDKGFIKPREIKAFQPINLRAVHSFMDYLDKSAHYINLAGWVRDVDILTRHADFRWAFIQTQGKEKYDVLRKWVEQCSQTNPLRFRTRAEKLLGNLRVNAVASISAFNLSMSMMQVSSVYAGMAAVGVFPVLKGLLQTLTNYEDVKMLMKSYAPEMYTRVMERELGELAMQKDIGKRIMGKLRPKEVGMLFLRAVDKWVATGVWQAALHEHFTKYPESTLEEAAEYATKIVRDTQPYFRIEDVPELWRAGEGWKMLTIFTNFLNQYWNMWIFDVFGKFKAAHMPDKGFPPGVRPPDGGDLDKEPPDLPPPPAGAPPEFSLWKLLEWIFMLAFLTPVTVGAIRRSRPFDDLKELGQDVTNQFVSGFPVLGNWISSSLYYNYASEGVVTTELFSSIQSFIMQVQKEDPELARLLDTGYGVFAVGAGLPYTQLRRSIQGAYDLTTGETDDWLRLIWSEYVREQLAGTPEGMQVILKRLNEREGELGQSVEPGVWYTTGKYGSDVLSVFKDAGFPEERLLMDSSGLSELQRLRLESNTVWAEYQRLETSSERLKYRAANPRVDAHLFFWEKVATLRSREASSIVLQMFTNYGMLEIPNFHWIDLPEPPEYVKLLYDYYLYEREK